MRFIFSVILFFLYYSPILAQNNLAAVSYYQLIKNEQKNIGKEIYFYKNSVSELNLKILRFQVAKSIDIIDSIPAYNNETQYKKYTVELFKYFLSVCDHQYKTLLQLVEDPELDNKEYRAKIQALFKDISAKEKPFDEKFNAAEDAYTLKYGIKQE